MLGVELLTELNCKPLAIQQDWFLENNDILRSFLNGSKGYDLANAKLPMDQFPQANQIAGYNVVSIKDYYDPWGEPKQLPENSIFTIDIEGPIIRSAACANGTVNYSSWLAKAASDKNVIACIININSPGGVVYGTNLFTQAMEDFKQTGKPLVARTNDGMAASAAYKIFSHAKYGFLSNAHDMVGSIGTMMVVDDITQQLKNEGIVRHFLYAPQSTDKNAPYHQLIDEGKSDMYVAMLKVLADNFISEIQTNRPQVKADAFTGKTYIGQDALDMGLADDFASFNQIVEFVYDKAKPKSKTKATNQKSTQNSPTMFDKYPAVSALASVETPSEEQIVAANENLAAKGIKGAVLVPQAFVEQFQNAEQKIKEVETLTASNTTLTEQVNELTSTNETLTARNEELEAWAKESGADLTKVKSNQKDPDPKGDGSFTPITGAADDPVTQKILKNR